MNEVRVLQLGNENWNDKYNIPGNIKIEYNIDLSIESKSDDKRKLYDIVFWTREPKDEELSFLYDYTKAYTLYVTENVKLSEKTQWLYDSKKGQRLSDSDIQEFLLKEVNFYFEKQYGEKFQMNNLSVSENFKGKVMWNGQYEAVFNGFFGKEFKQLAFWRNNIPIFANQVLDLWLEYKKTPGVEIALTVTRILSGSLSEIVGRQVYSEEDMKNVIQITCGNRAERIFVSVSAKGSGKVRIIALHDRYSRGTHGYFLPGGERYVTSDREELFCYFDPMDRKPPLNIYFSGYKTAEGFEGYNMMRKIGAPYLLITDSRLEGGCFYMGSEEYEQLISDVIRKYIKELNFTTSDVVMSGLSMGTFGALYYGCDIKPHAIILGKPLASIGNVAANEKRIRPGGFSTSLDVLNYICHNTDESSVKNLNEKFWNRFDKTNWEQTKFIISYMIEDDYDSTAYKKLISHIKTDGVQLYGKGLHGRHNDNTYGIVSWFKNQYKKVMWESYKRTT